MSTPAGRPTHLTLLFAAQVTLLDLAAKQWAQQALLRRRSFGPIELLRTYNDGLLMGLGSDAGAGVILAGTAAITAVIAVMVLRGGVPVLPGGLMLGGALGNVLDRLADGRVTDLLQVGSSPVFNLADVSITLGFVLALALATAAGEPDPDRDDAHRP